MSFPFICLVTCGVHDAVYIVVESVVYIMPLPKLPMITCLCSTLIWLHCDLRAVVDQVMILDRQRVCFHYHLQCLFTFEW